MDKASIRDRLATLENRRRFLDWFVRHRFWATLRLEELERFAAGGGLPDPVGKLFVEWRSEPEEKDTESGSK
jgi:hypothetical protein